MNKHPLDQQDANVPDKDSSDTTQPPPSKRSKFRMLFESLASISAKSLTQSLGSQDPSQQSTQSFGASQVDDNQGNPLSIAQTEGLLRSVIFPENITKPAVKTALPGLQDRIERTDQLLYCNILLRQDSVASWSPVASEEIVTGDLANAPQELTLDKAEQNWLTEVKGDPIGQDRMQWFVTKMVEAFITDATKDSTKVAEVVALGPVLQREPYRKLLSSFIADFDDSRILNVNLLQGLVQLVQSASPGFLVSDDLVKVFSLLRTHLEGTHQHSSEHLCHLTSAVSRILDVMADHKIQDLDRIMEHEPLSAVLSGLRDSSDPYLMYQACYAFQALQYVPDYETVLQVVLRHSTGMVDGLVKVTCVMKLDLGSVLEGLEKLQEIAVGAIGIAATVYGGVGSLRESGREVLESLKEGLGSSQKRPWYPAIRVAYAFVQAGQLKDLKQLIYEAPCRQDALFQWGICQLLGEIAADSVWTVATRQQAIDLLGYLYKEDQEWGRDESVKAWMVTILDKLRSVSDQAINSHAIAQFQKLDSGNTPRTQNPYPLRSHLPIPESSPILAKVQKIPYMEYELYKLRMQRLDDAKLSAKLSIYIPPMAKANLQARDNEVFPLMDKVRDFMAGDTQVMLVLGDSGAGKSTFNRHLEHELWQEYKTGGRIPLFVNLPSLERPEKDLVAEQLRTYNLLEDQIYELKLHRQFMLVCDGYDESQLTSNLHTTNLFNRSGQWDVKLLITCRTQYLGPDYRSRFEPKAVDRYTRVVNDLFQQAVIAPFSREQIEGYVEHYVPLEPRSWVKKDYMDKLEAIPNLMDLVRNPFLLTLSLEALPTVVQGKTDLYRLRVTRAELYDTFVRHWMAVNKRRLEDQRLDRENQVAFEELLEAGFEQSGVKFQQDLATAIFVHQDGRPVVDYINKHDKSSWKAAFFSIDCETSLLRGASLLSRAGTQYRFVHRSILEYFFASAICGLIKEHGEYDPPILPDASFTSPTISIHPLSLRNLAVEPSIIQFLAERVQLDSGFKDELLTIIEQSKNDNQAAQAAANAITILVKARVRFNGVDLRGIRIPGADLTGGQFDSAQLQDADLTGVNLSKTWIRQADLSRAGMGETQFGELPCLEELEGVSSCAFSLDGKFLAAGLYSGDISIYDTVTWTKIQVFQGHQKAVTSLAYSPNSQQLLSGSWDKTARLWNSETGSTDLILEGHPNEMKAGAFYAMSSSILDEVPRFRTSETGSADFILDGHSNEVRAVAFSPTGQQVATVSNDHSVILWDARTGASVFVLTNRAGAYSSIAYSPNGNTIASTGWNETIRIFDTLTGLLILESCEGNDWIMSLAYSLDGQRIATGSLGGQLQLWEAATTTLVPGWKEMAHTHGAAHTHGITSIAFSPDDQWIASSSFDRTVKLWDSRSGALISSFVSQMDCVSCVRFSPSGSYIASASYDKTLRLWEVNPLTTRFDSHDIVDPQLCVTYSPDGRQLITGSRNAPMRQFNADSGDVDFVFQDHLYGVHCIAFSPCGLRLAVGSDQQVTLWSAESRAAPFVLPGHESVVSTVAFSPCGRWLASGGYDGTVRFWDTYSGAPDHVLRNHPEYVYSVEFSPDGRWIASAYGEGKALLLEVVTSELDAERTINIVLHRENFVVDKLGCLQEASCDGDGTIRLWDYNQQHQSLRYILKEDQEGSQLTFSSCSQWVTTAHNTSVRLWKLPSPEHGQQALPLQVQDCVSVIEGFTRSVNDVVWRPNTLEFATASIEGSIRAWRVVEDNDGSGRVSVDLVWSSGPAVLVASGAVLNGVVGLSAMNRRLLEQRGATGSASSD
ncbi:hypothetical protein KI688_012904 [Linnemannia hyalina]|uniref:WD40 repeat-like protein n=1 Tax=Linnemannia hyalina TaxID=64524 RepID=A0A9P7XTT9_9FUNG|nr:hypothetical protein KI688_012904 [Linnemannia hyalina]